MADPARRREQLREAAKRYYRGHVDDVVRCKMLRGARTRGRVPREATLRARCMDATQFVAELRAFLEAHPDSKAEQRVRRFLERTKQSAYQTK